MCLILSNSTPYRHLTLVARFLILGITLTLVSDMCPRGMVVRSIALLSLLTTALAAGLQLLIPLLKGIVMSCRVYIVICSNRVESGWVTECKAV